MDMFLRAPAVSSDGAILRKKRSVGASDGENALWKGYSDTMEQKPQPANTQRVQHASHGKCTRTNNMGITEHDIPSLTLKHTPC